MSPDRPIVAPPPPGPAPTGPSFRAKLMAGVCALVVATGLAVTWVSQRTAAADARALGESIFREVSRHAVTHARGHVQSAAPVVDSLRNLAAGGTLALGANDTDRLARQLTDLLEANASLSWAYYADEAGTFTGALRRPDGGLRVNQSHITPDGRTALVEHDVADDGSWTVYRREADSGYEPRKRPYYIKAAAAGPRGEPVWLEPYMFYLDGVPGVSCAAPVRERDGSKPGALRGVVAVDFDLGRLSEFISTLSVSEHSRVFLFTRDQSLLAHPSLRRLVAGQATTKATTTPTAAPTLPTLADAGDPVIEAYRDNLRPEYLPSANAQAGAGAFRPFEFTRDGQRYLASATAFHVGGDQVWFVGAVAPESDFLAGVWRSQSVSLAAALGAVLLGVLLAALMARSVSRPIASLIAFTRRVGAGDLEAKADFSGGGREFRELSGALNQMIDDLRDRLRLRHSLNLAMEVQQRLLPSKPPTVRGLDVAGHSTYCDETGGDYYDFLVVEPPPSADGSVNDGQLLLALGDVMGHGIAAALVMAGARAVLRDRAGTAGGLAELMSRLNALLAADLDGTRFMTMHLAIVDSRAAVYRWVSAGHDPAIIYDPATSDFIEIDEGDLPLGVMADTTYEEHSYGQLRPGQVILVGTDGIWEMPNVDGEQFGKDRLRDAMRGSAGGSAADVAGAVLGAVHAFRGDCRPMDDVTFVVIKCLAVGAAADVAHAIHTSHDSRSAVVAATATAAGGQLT